MPMYDMVDVATGDVVELFFTMADAPKVGERRTIDSKTYERVIDPSSLQLTTDPVSGRFPVASRSLPLRMPGFEHDKRGRTVLRNQADKDRLKAHGWHDPEATKKRKPKKT